MGAWGSNDSAASGSDDPIRTLGSGNSLRLSRRADLVLVVHHLFGCWCGGTHQWYLLDNRHQVLPTVHLRSGFGTTALRYEMVD